MWFRNKSVLLSILLLCAAVPATSSAQQNHQSMGGTYSSATKSPTLKNVDRHTKPFAPHLLTPDEGLAVLGSALESRAHSDLEADCSHLVHTIYQRAGFTYPYANSSTLYAGSTAFRRVARPQPGDLVVWPGHVGIAVNPAQRSFFSALSSGLGVAYYDSAYWRERGRPRFFRYVAHVPTAIEIASSSREDNLKTTAGPELNPPTAGNKDPHGKCSARDPNRSSPDYCPARSGGKVGSPQS
jgi:hypothetical protein